MPRTAPYNRDHALDAAMTLFWRRGYHATSLKDLEQALAMKPGSIYAAFKSKENLFRLSLQRYFDKGGDRLAGYIDAAPTPLAGLAAYLRSHLECPEDPTAARACMLAKTVLEMTDAPGPVGEEARAYLRGMATRFADVYRAAIAAGELPADADPDRLARRLQVKVLGLTVFLQRETDRDMLHDLIEDLVAETASPLPPRPPAPAAAAPLH